VSRFTQGDYLVAGAIVVFAVLAVALHSSIAGLADMGAGIRRTGVEIERSGKATAGEIRSSVGKAADAVGALPVVGGSVGSAVRETADRSAAAVERETRISGRELAAAGAQGEEDARSTARLVGWMSFLVPTFLILAAYLPRRLESLPRAEGAHGAG
jgi:hypothetical protein